MKLREVHGEADAREARRRARILDRYDAIERPSAEDDAAAATEMGLSVDTMLRLAAAWRRHRNEAVLVGKGSALARIGQADREQVMAEKIDLDLVRSDRRAEILRRIRILQRHIAATERGDEDVVADAKDLGVPVPRFRVLVRTWLLHARAEALPGATRAGTPWRRQPGHARRQKLLRAALDASGPHTSLKAVYEGFAAACIAENLKPLSMKRFYGIVHEIRAADPEQEH